MNRSGLAKYKLIPRNEGKIKLHESCHDIRAWSHDSSRRDSYLREWMRNDMQICVLPVCTIASFLSNMTLKSRARAPPRCHPDCKSKVLLESICNSCHAIKECIKDDVEFEKYFEQEEFETSHWPCETCINALKTVKMLWKILLHKVLRIKMSQDNFDTKTYSRSGSVKSLAKLWQDEIIEQTLYVRRIPRNCNSYRILKISSRDNLSRDNKIRPLLKQCKTDGDDVDDNTILKGNFSVSKKPTKSYIKSKTTSKNNTIKVKTVDFGCDCNIFNGKEDVFYKNKAEILQNTLLEQKFEMERLNRENKSLRIELENVYKSCTWKASYHSNSPNSNASKYSVSLVPREHNICNEKQENMSSLQSINSEIRITMKKCKNENFRYISLLQVLHKSNNSTHKNLSVHQLNKQQNPVEVLTKVENTFGAIVRREMLIANESARRSNIDSSYHRATTYRTSDPGPSRTTLSSGSITDFRSAQEASDKNN